MIDAPQPWDRQPGEPMLWFARFETYRLIGPKRSILGVYREERAKAGKGDTDSIPKAWELAARRWRWKERAEAWDAAEIERKRAEEEEDRRQEREQRLQMLRATRQLMGRRIAKWIEEGARGGGTSGFEAMSAGAFVAAMTTIFREQRAEYGDDVSRVELSGPDGKPLQHQEVPALDLSALSPDELALFEGLWRKLIGVSDGNA